MRVPPWLAMLLLLAAATAHADPPPPDLDLEVAQQRFRAGAQFYLQSEFERALTEFEAARAAKPLPALDYNIARCLDRLGRYQQALEAYQRFVDHSEAATDRGVIEEARRRIAVLRERVPPPPAAGTTTATAAGTTTATAAVAAAPQPARAEARAARPVWKRPLFWGLLSAGVVVVVTGVALGVALSRSPSAPTPSLGHMDIGR